HWRRVIQPMLDLSPLAEQGPSEDHRIAQAGRELRRPLVQSPLQNMVNPEFKPGCSERRETVPKAFLKTSVFPELGCPK
ncbi:unnamed protein product, partial [Bubo scandiacus]